MDTISEAKHCSPTRPFQNPDDMAKASAHFDGILEAHPNWPEAWNNRGATHHLMGDLVGALTDFNRALEINPGYAEAYNNRGIVRHSLSDFAGALADFNKALEIRPRYAEALSSRGTTRQALHDLHGALADFDQSIGIRTDHVEAYLGRSSVLHAKRDFEGALADYDQVLKLIPRASAAPVYHLRAGVRMSQRRFAKALAECNHALEIDGQFCMAYISRANARYHLRDSEGLADYAAAFRINARAAAAEIVRIVKVDLRDDVEAVIDNCRKHVKICPNDVVAYTRRGLTLLLQGNEAEAACDFKQVLQRTPAWRGNLDLIIETAQNTNS